MRALKHHTTTYNSLHHCLEAHFGEHHSFRNPKGWKHGEAEQGRRTIPFQSRYSLQLDYMARRPHRLTQLLSLLKK